MHSRKITHTLATFAIGILLLCVGFAHAEATDKPDKSNLSSNTTPPDLSEKITSIKHTLIQKKIIEGGFTQERELSGFSRKLKSSGNFIYAQEHGFFWEITSPFYRATSFLKNKTINWSSPETIANESKPGIIQKQINKILVALLSGNFDTLGKHFTIEDILPETLQKNHWAFTLTPKQVTVQKQISSISLEGRDYIKRLVITGAKKDKTVIDFSKPEGIDEPQGAHCRKFYPDGDNPCKLGATL